MDGVVFLVIQASNPPANPTTHAPHAHGHRLASINGAVCFTNCLAVTLR